jgi:inactivated superfamily I helicase
MTHDDAIEWPNGEGFTPCTREYAELIDKRDALKPDWINLDDLSPADYQEWCTLDAQLNQLQCAGHLGKSVRY